MKLLFKKRPHGRVTDDWLLQSQKVKKQVFNALEKANVEKRKGRDRSQSTT